jgi:hypothetical protein
MKEEKTIVEKPRHGVRDTEESSVWVMNNERTLPPLHSARSGNPSGRRRDPPIVDQKEVE